MLFLINLVLAVATLWNAIEDHSEALSAFRDSNGPGKGKSWRKLFLLWLFPVLSIAAIPLTWNAETESEDQISKAKAAAALANERASTNELRVAEIKATNLVLIAIGEKAKESAALATEAAEKAKTERALAEKAVEEFRQTNLDLQNRVEELKATNRQLSQVVVKLTPRQLTHDDVDWLEVFLRNEKKEPVRIRADQRDSESYRFALDIQSALARSGINVGSIEPWNASVLIPLEIQSPFNRQPAPIALALAKAFTAIGHETEVSPGITTAGIVINVGGNRQRHKSTFERLFVNGRGDILPRPTWLAADKLISRILVNPLGTNVHVQMLMKDERNFRLPPLGFFIAPTNRLPAVFGEPQPGLWDFKFSAPAETNLDKCVLQFEVWP